MRKKIVLAVLLAAALPMSALAAVRVDAHLSTLGGGLEVALPISEGFDARVGFNRFNLSFTQSSGGLNYKGDFKLSSVTALADWRPFSGTAHLTAGAVFNGNKFAMNATTVAGSVYNINGANYTATGDESIATDVSFNKVSPYLGFGWSGNPKHSGLSFSTDFGLLFQGSPKASVTATGTWNGANPTQLASDAQTQMNADLKNFKIYPVASVGIAYAF